MVLGYRSSRSCGLSLELLGGEGVLQSPEGNYFGVVCWLVLVLELAGAGVVAVLVVDG